MTGLCLLEAQVVQHAAFMRIAFHGTAMRAAVGAPIPLAGILVLLHHFVMFAFFLGALFRRQ
jgi:hypothetical protein